MVGCFYSLDKVTPYKENDMFPLVIKSFGKIKVPVPKNYEVMLKDMYGDYMQLPPSEERYHINFIYADLGDGERFVIDPIHGSLGEKALNNRE